MKSTLAPLNQLNYIFTLFCLRIKANGFLSHNTEFYYYYYYYYHYQ